MERQAPGVEGASTALGIATQPNIAFQKFQFGKDLQKVYIKPLPTDVRDDNRDNADLYLENIEAIMRHRFALMDQLNDYQHRYARLERLVSAHPRAYDALRGARRVLRDRRRGSDEPT